MDNRFDEFHDEFPELKEGAIGNMVKSAFAPTTQALKGMQTGMQQFMKNTHNTLIPGGEESQGEPLQSAPAAQATPQQKKQKPKQVLKSFASGERQDQANAANAQSAAADPKQASALIANALDVIKAISSIQAAPANESIDISLYREGIDPIQAIQAAKNFIGQIGNKDASALSAEEMKDLSELVAALTDQKVMKVLLPKMDDKSKQKIQSLNIQALQTAIQTLANAPAEQKTEVITTKMDPAMLNGVLANALAQVQDKSALKKYLAPIVMKYGQTDNLTVYSWRDIQSMVNIAKKFGANIDMRVKGVDWSDSPGGAQQPQSEPASTAPTEPPPTTTTPEQPSDTIGAIVQKLQSDPDMIRDLVDYSVSQKPKNLKNLATKYGIAITQEDLDFINQQSAKKGKK